MNPVIFDCPSHRFATHLPWHSSLFLVGGLHLTCHTGTTERQGFRPGCRRRAASRITVENDLDSDLVKASNAIVPFCPGCSVRVAFTPADFAARLTAPHAPIQHSHNRTDEYFDEARLVSFASLDRVAKLDCRLLTACVGEALCTVPGLPKDARDDLILFACEAAADLWLKAHA